MKYPRHTMSGGPGVTEEQLHAATGLRTGVFTGFTAPGSASLCLDGTVAMTPSTGLDDPDQATIPVNNPSMSIPCTPCVSVIGNPGLAADTEFQVRVYGINQFGEAIQEETPHIVVGSNIVPGTYRVWLSKVFAQVTAVRYSSVVGTGVTSLGLAVGPHMIWNQSETPPATELWDTASLVNMGIGTPMRVNYSPNQSVSIDQKIDPLGLIHPDVFSLQVINHTNPAPPLAQANIAVVPPIHLGSPTTDGGFYLGNGAGVRSGSPGDHNKVRIRQDATRTISNFARTGGVRMYDATGKAPDLLEYRLTAHSRLAQAPVGHRQIITPTP